MTSHSPYVAERYLNEEILVLRHNGDSLSASAIQQAGGIEPKRLRQDLRIRYAEGLLSNAVLLCERISDRAAFAEINCRTAAGRRAHERRGKCLTVPKEGRVKFFFRRDANVLVGEASEQELSSEKHRLFKVFDALQDVIYEI